MTSSPEQEPQFHGIEVQKFADPRETAYAVASKIESLIRKRRDAGVGCVLGLATGSTPIPVYAELVRRHREDGLSFANVTTFNLDEYHPMDEANRHSYHAFMRRHLFDHVDIERSNTHLPSGSVSRQEVQEHCSEYESLIKESGGIDMQLLGIGRTGHIGFNEPGSTPESRTRLVELVEITRNDAADSFGGIDKVPKYAITMGISTILDAKEIVLMGIGQGKRDIIRRTLVSGPPSSDVPATFLRGHSATSFYLDKAAV
ncbi:MAG: 6-phosphogluconolactonase [Planctomycetota bacterium]